MLAQVVEQQSNRLVHQQRRQVHDRQTSQQGANVQPRYKRRAVLRRIAPEQIADFDNDLPDGANANPQENARQDR